MTIRRKIAVWFLTLYGFVLFFSALPAEFLPDSVNRVRSVTYKQLFAAGLTSGHFVFSGAKYPLMYRSVCLVAYGQSDQLLFPIHESFPGCKRPSFRMFESTWDAFLRTRFLYRNDAKMAVPNLFPGLGRFYCSFESWANPPDVIHVGAYYQIRDYSDGSLSSDFTWLAAVNCKDQGESDVPKPFVVIHENGGIDVLSRP